MSGEIYPKNLDGAFQAIQDLIRRVDGLYAAHDMDTHSHKPETWQDVTAECDRAVNLKGHEMIVVKAGYHGHPADTVPSNGYGYRLRKVKLYQRPEDAGYGKPVYAFIVEKKGT